jgi:hypothetical protein
MSTASRRVYERRGRLVRDGWQSYAEKILPKNAPSVQRQETRRAFYAGAWELLCRHAELGEPDISEDEGVEVLEATKREIEAFILSIGTPREGR